MKLNYSLKGTPYIEFDDENRLIFSSINKNYNGYKYLVFSGKTTVTVEVSSGRGKKGKKKANIVDDVSFTSTMLLDKIPRDAKGNKYLSKINIGIIKNMIGKYITKDNIFPDSKIKLLEDDINSIGICDEDYLDEDPNGYIEDEDDDI